MKMSDAINLLIDGSKKHGVLAKSEDVEIAVDTLINQHDQLVELNKGLVGALESMIEANECKELPSPHWVISRQALAISLVKKAKELL